MTYGDEENWFYIKHKSTGRVIASACENHNDSARSQVVVIEPRCTSSELWCWDEHCFKNKSTGLVLDIRKGNSCIIFLIPFLSFAKILFFRETSLD